MPLQSVTIQSTTHGSRLIGEDIHTAHHLDIPIPPDDLYTLIIAATKTEDTHLRAELGGVLADRTPNGVRVHVVAKTSHFDIPWPVIARGIQRK
ncbi:hypothetical protein [uncultured Roseovarius sp.]|uniref:hypothetical protein n=1 Tax=uncultured Roseovarius sp. TaxID=293344 RepID=UPI00263813F9|nr:hypothetical protein [uncultured Roseovarius sp.]